MAKEFKKGEAVTLVRNWNSKGEFAVTAAIVYSCGAKQMVLTDAETGYELGRNFLPTEKQYSRALVLKAGVDAQAVALECAKKFIADEIAEYERRLTINHPDFTPSYKAAIARHMEEAKAFVPSVVVVKKDYAG